ncbi:hypothetical protein [Bacillus kexueae]|uniref:hypothetical protein n=1 Tax=Aeribacillus kexueae TaxID=2078952 RepID=UPI001FAFC063|nr:hypothetical protein [Bacillus kexueae]
MDWIHLTSFSIIALFMISLLTYNAVLTRQLKLLKKSMYVVIKQQDELKKSLQPSIRTKLMKSNS